MPNVGIREAARALGVRWWQVADVLGVSEAYVTRMLRHELTEEQRERVLAAINEVVRARDQQEGGGGVC